MNNRILAALFALAIALFIGVAPVKAEAAHTHYDNNGDNVCDVSSCTAHVHHLTHFEANPATCEEEGWIEYWQCLTGTGACGKCYTDAEATHEITGAETRDPATGHSDPDKDCVCNVCQELLAHTLKEVPAVAVTCTTDGNYAYKECETCGQLFWYTSLQEATLEELTITATGHNASGVWIQEESGHWHACQNNDCQEKLDFAEHTLVMKSDGTQHWMECTVCGYQKDREDHDWERTSNGECSGTHVTQCTVCGEVNGLTNPCVDANNDCYCDWCGALMPHQKTSLKKVAKVPATCEGEGVALHYQCAICENIFKYENGTCIPTTLDELKLDPIGHQVSADATWERDGTAHWHLCENSGCGEILDKADHTLGEWVATHETHHWKVCSVCGEVIGMEEHTFVWTSLGDGTHIRMCECGATKGVAKACSDSLTDEDCVCDICADPVAHTREMLKKIAAVPATCTTDGTKEHFQCKTCGALFVKENGVFVEVSEQNLTVGKLGHDFVYSGNVSAGASEWKTAHLYVCSRCTAYKTEAHTDPDGDCYCNLEGCNAPVHSHEIIEVPGQEANCQQEGFDTYYKYAGCDTYFEDPDGNVPLKVLVVTEKTDHTFGPWTSVDGKHVRTCTVCGFEESGDHVDDVGNDNYCDVCGAALKLEHVPQKDPTCTDNGYKECWKSPVTGRMYADPDGTQYITEREVIPATGHVYTKSDGVNHICEVCGHKSAHVADKEFPCFCGICNLSMSGHEVTLISGVAPTCTKPGSKGFYACICGDLYDEETLQKIDAPISIPATGHTLSTTCVESVLTGNHYQVCVNDGCTYKAYSDHTFVVEDPLKGNYHQEICKCGYLKTELHYDKDGDKKCDECGHDMSGTTAQGTTGQVEQHDSVKVTTGDKTTVDNTKTWWQNWWGNLFSSNAGTGASSSTTTTTTGGTSTSGSNTNTTGGTSNSGTGTTATNSKPSTGSSTPTTGGASTSGSGTTTVSSKPSSGSSAANSDSTGIINTIIQTLTQFFAFLFQGM